MVEKKRYAILDSYRGFVVLNMIAFHFLYDLNMIFGKNVNWYTSIGVRIWQQFICWSFIILSGFVWGFGKQKAWKRGLLVNVIGLVITLVTVVAMPEEAIWFGILNFIGCSMLLMIPIHRWLEKIPDWLGMLLSMLTFLLLYHINIGVLGFGEYVIHLPKQLYEYTVLIPFGFPTQEFASSDYFPMLPWFLLYVFGYYFGKWFAGTKLFEKICGMKMIGIDFIGRHSLWFYMAHQPICYLVCLLICK